MSKYHVYGIGNALVDMEYEVEPEDLSKLRIDKGVMTLVDEAHQIEIMAHLDGCHHAKACGGSAANSVIALSQFGGRGFYSCKVADDALGHFYLEDLIANGVDTNRHGEREKGHTGRCVVLVTPDTDRTMVTYLGVSGGLAAGELVDRGHRRERLLLHGGLSGDLRRRPRCGGGRAGGCAKGAGTKTAISLSDPNMVTHFKAGSWR